MNMTRVPFSRRQFLHSTLASAVAAGTVSAQSRDNSFDDKALIAITLDLEMSRHYPKWDIMHWDYEKGNLNEATKQYTVEACRRVKARGGVLQSFVVGQVFEQENVDWLKEVVAEGRR